MNKVEARNWGSNTIKATREIVTAAKAGADVIEHFGLFDTKSRKHLSAISSACRSVDVELVVHNVVEPGYPVAHVSFV